MRLIKRSKKRGRQVRETISYLLNFLTKDMRPLFNLFAEDYRRYDCLHLYEKNVITAIIKLLHQQEEMHRNGIYQCLNRIVNIFQPHARPIVRGKAGAKIEFGAKIGVSLVDGYTFIDHYSWEAYNESTDMLLHIELYEKRFGCLPSTILVDSIYINSYNRKLLRAMEINTYCKPLGRPPKEPLLEEIRAKMEKSLASEMKSNVHSVQSREFIELMT